MALTISVFVLRMSTVLLVIFLEKRWRDAKRAVTKYRYMGKLTNKEKASLNSETWSSESESAC